MSPKSGSRFSEKDMRQNKNLEHIPSRLNRDVLWRRRRRGNIAVNPGSAAKAAFSPAQEQREVKATGLAQPRAAARLRLRPAEPAWWLPNSAPART